jgi:GTP-binding protein Era
LWVRIIGQQPTTSNQEPTILSNTPFRFGHVALIGKPNVGKSTLLNRIVGQKVSIVSNKPQTTRRKALGIANGDGWQIVFVDTPGIHDPHTRLGRSMVDQARSGMADIEVAVYVADGSHHPGEMDKQIAEMMKANLRDAKLILCLNKMDLLKAESVERNVNAYMELFGTEEYMLTTATRGENVDRLMDLIIAHLPEGAPQYGEDEFTDQTSRFLAAELVREKILHATRDEVPHSVAVLIDAWDEQETPLRIEASILVEKASQRGILIGKGGQFLKAIGTKAREEIEEILGQKVFLALHVKVAEGWRQNPRMLAELEYRE